MTVSGKGACGWCETFTPRENRGPPSVQIERNGTLLGAAPRTITFRHTSQARTQHPWLDLSQ
eukprot:7117661-Prymnesium_polylepis.1